MSTASLLPSASDFATDVPASLALAAYGGVSHSPERRAEASRADYANALAADYAALAALAESDAERSTLAAEFGRYREGCRRRYCAFLASNARCVSWFICGPSGYPAARMQKRADVAHRRLTEFLDFRKRALAAIRETLRPVQGPIMAGDADAVERLTLEIAEAESRQERMRDANDAIRKHAKAGRDAQLAALQILGFPLLEAAKLLTPDFCSRIGFPDYALTNNAANIRRMKARLTTIRRDKATPATELPGTDGRRFEDCPAANRVRVFFPGKPAAEVRADLKRAGFRWSPTIGAWQAYRNSSSIATARRVAGVSECHNVSQSAEGSAAIADEAKNPAAAPAASGEEAA